MIFLNYVSLYVAGECDDATTSTLAADRVNKILSILEDSLEGATPWWYTQVYHGFIEQVPDFRRCAWIITLFGPKLKAVWDDWLSFHPGFSPL